MARSDELNELTLPLADDWHQHLRQDDLARAVVPLIRPAGIQRCIVMPNIIPPVTTPDMAVAYHDELLKAGAAPSAHQQGLDLKMLLYLSPELTPDMLKAAAEDAKYKKPDGSNLITGVKSYPRGVTTNSDAGVESYEVYYPQFEAMQELGLVLHLHGEVPGQSVMLAEACFLSELEKLAAQFPKLKIVLEHVSTKEAVDLVCSLGENVAASVTAHHLDICIDQVVGCCHHFCKPVPKLPRDRDAIREVGTRLGV